MTDEVDIRIRVINFEVNKKMNFDNGSLRPTYIYSHNIYCIIGRNVSCFYDSIASYSSKRGLHVGTDILCVDRLSNCYTQDSNIHSNCHCNSGTERPIFPNDSIQEVNGRV